MNIRQKGFERNPRMQPKNWQAFLKIGKVVKVDQAQKTVDVSMMDGSGKYHNVPVLSSMASTASGISYLPQPHLPEENRDEPEAFFRRDLFAVIGFINGAGTMPVVLGFKHPEENQLSFPNNEGFENQLLERHEGDRYHRIIGDTVSELGGQDAPSEEEIRYPDNSYFRIFKRGGSKKLVDITVQNEDADVQPFRVKKEDSKGFYFQHSSGTRVLIDPDGQVKISHHTGTWLSISPADEDVSIEPVELQTVDSKTAPPAAPDSTPVKVHLNHSSGSRFTILPNGKIEVVGMATVDIDGAGSGLVKGAVQGDCICSYTGQIHPMVSETVKASL